MKAAIKSNFLRNLESGRFRKGRGLLKYQTVRGKVCHCALGILAEMYEEATSGRAGKFRVITEPWRTYTDDSTGAQLAEVYSISGESTKLPTRVLEWAGLGSFDASQIASINDEGKYSKSFAKVIKYVRNEV